MEKPTGWDGRMERAMQTAIATEDIQRVEWTGSKDGAPGPGVDGHLYGDVLRVSPKDNNSIKIKWDNERVTIERRKNLTWIS
jgi:hypothetical protein